MQYLIIILIAFITINTVLKLSFWKFWQVAIAVAIIAAFVWFTYPFAIKLSKPELTMMLQNPNVMQNIAVIITLESVIFFAFSFASLRQFFGKKVKPYLMLPLHFYPGLLLFPTSFFILGQLIFSFPGTDFGFIAKLTAGGIALIVLLVTVLFKYLLPEKDFRLELLFITNLFTCIIGLISTVNGNTVYKAVQQPLNATALLIALGGGLLIFAIGFIINRYRKLKF